MTDTQIVSLIAAAIPVVAAAAYLLGYWQGSRMAVRCYDKALKDTFHA